MSDDEKIPPQILNQLLSSMFAISPIAMSITTSEGCESRYLRVNDAYLSLVGRSWSELRGVRVVEKTVHDDEARARRHSRLQNEGGYVGEYVEIHRADGVVVPTLISSQRSVIEGTQYDVEIIVDISSRVTEQRKHEETLETLARTDVISGLPNRRAFDEQLSEAFRNPTATAPILALLDLNGFKAINDIHGHAIGDEVLRLVSTRLHESRRGNDFVARIGGDEFAILFYTGGQDLPQARVDDLLAAIGKPMNINGITLSVGSAIGMARLEPGEDVAALYQRADAKMYEMKRGAHLEHRAEREI